MKKPNSKVKKTHKILELGGGSLLLASFSLASIGFSSWIVISQISEAEGKNAQVNVATITSDKIGIFSNLSSKAFTLCQDGALNNETIVSEVQLSVSLKINKSICGKYSFLYGDDNNALKMRTSLTCNSSEFLNLLTAFECDDSSASLDEEPSEYTTEYVRDLSVTLANDTTSLTFTYTFKDEDESGSSSFFKSYYENKPSFSFNVEAIVP